MEEINVDSLQQLLPELKGTEKIDALNKLSLALCRDDPDSSISIAKYTIALSEQADYQKGRGDGFFNRGMAYSFSDSLKPSTINYLNALRIYEEIEPSTNELAETLMQLSFLNWIAGRYGIAREYCRKAKDIYKSVSNCKGEAWAVYTLSHFCNTDDTRQYDSAMYYLDRTLEILDEYPDQKILFMAYQNYGNCYYSKYWDEKPETLDFLYKSIELYFKAYENIKLRYDSSEKISAGMSSILGNIGAAYIDTDLEENILKGYDYTEQAKNIIESVNPAHPMLTSHYGVLGYVKKGQGKYEEAIELYLKGINIADSALSNFVFKNYENPFDGYNALFFTRYFKRRLHSHLYRIFLDRGDFQNALEHYQHREKINDIISRGENQKLIAMLEAESENEKTENQITLLARDNELKDIKVRQSRMFNLGVGILFVILILVGILFIRQNKMRNEHKNTLLEQKLLRLQMNPHFIFNALSNIMDFIEEKNTENATRYLSSFSKLLRTTLESSRQDNILLEQEVSGLKNYLDLQRLRYENNFDYTVTVDDLLDAEEVTIPPMLIQPFIENAIEHGVRHKETTGHIDVRFLLKGNQLVCEVEDDGIGREKAWETEYRTRKEHKSLATSIIMDRIKAINRKMKQKIRLEIIDLKSEDNRPSGTRVVLDVPLI